MRAAEEALTGHAPSWQSGGFPLGSLDPAPADMLPPLPPSHQQEGEEQEQKPPLDYPLLTPKPDPADESSGGPGHMTLSTSGLTASRDSSPKGLLARINLLEQTIDGQLKSLKYLQSNLMEELFSNQHANHMAEVTKVQQTQEEISRLLTHSIDTLTNLNDTQLLAAADAHKLALLLDKLDLHAQRLRIYQDELNNTLSGRPYEPTAALIITQQPFPCTIKQGKSIDEPVEVSLSFDMLQPGSACFLSAVCCFLQITLLTGAKVEIQKMGPVKAEMLSEENNPPPKKKSNEPPIQNGVQARNMVMCSPCRCQLMTVIFA